MKEQQTQVRAAAGGLALVKEGNDQVEEKPKDEAGNAAAEIDIGKADPLRYLW